MHDLDKESLRGIRRFRVAVHFSESLEQEGYDARTLEVLLETHLRGAGIEVIDPSAGEKADAVLELSDHDRVLDIGGLVAVLDFRVLQPVNLARVPSLRLMTPTWIGGPIVVRTIAAEGETTALAWKMVQLKADEFLGDFREVN